MSARSHKQAGIDRAICEPVYILDWLGEPTLQTVSLEVEGAWFRTCLLMWQRRIGSISDTLEGWAKFWRKDKAGALAIIHSLKDRGVADVCHADATPTASNAEDVRSSSRHPNAPPCHSVVTSLSQDFNGLVTLTCRRLKRREQERLAAAERQRQARQRRKSRRNHAQSAQEKAPPSSSFSSSLSSSSPECTNGVPPPEGGGSPKPSASDPPPRPAPALDNLATESATVIQAWNDLALREHLPRMIDVTEKRKRALRSRLSDESWRSRWREALDDLAKCPFLLGGNDRGWKANFDWFIRPDSVTKILEGAYRGQPTVRITGQMPFDREDASKFDVLKARTHICYNDPSSSRGLQGPDSVHSREAR